MIKNIVFSGGSLKGFCFVGVLKFLEENNKLDNITSIAGTSVGACVALLFNIGYTSDELSTIFLNINIEEHRDIDYENLFDIINTYGLDKGNNIIKIFKIILKKKYDENITFNELYEKTKKKLYIVGTCLNDMETIYYSYKTFPDMKILDALRISFSIPFLFEPIIIDNKYYVDGGLTNNYAINLFDNNIKTTLGIIVSNTISKEINTIEDFFFASISTNYIQQIKTKIKLYKQNTIHITCDNISFINFSLDKIKKQELIDLGYNYTKNYFNNLS